MDIHSLLADPADPVACAWSPVGNLPAMAGADCRAGISPGDGIRHSRAAWALGERLLPPLHWQEMPKGREWLARPEMTS